MANKLKCVKNTSNEPIEQAERERGIGHSSYQSLTKSDLIKLIDKNFPDESHNLIAVLTTVSYGDYRNPTVMQTLTLGKILED